MNTLKTKDIINIVTIIPFVLYAFWGLSPYFTWKNFYGGIFGYIGGIPYSSILGAMSIGAGILYVAYRKVINKRMVYLFCGAVFLAFSVVLLGGGVKHALSFEWIIFLVPAIYVLLPIDLKGKCFNIYYNIIVFSLIAPIIIYILVHIGINVPHIEIMADESIKSSAGYSYIIYPFASQWSRYGITYYTLRLCGIYNEPGLLGTIVALLLVQQEFRLKNNWKNCVLLIGGVLSFSLGFYMVTAIYLIIRNIAKLNGKRMFILIGIVVLYFVFISVDFSNPDIANFQSRLLLTANGLSGDTRTNPLYDIEFMSWMHSDFLHILFGYGHGELEAILQLGNIDGCSYKTLFYDYGVIGVTIQFIWIFSLLYIEKRGVGIKNYKEIFVFFAVYVINMYQRPSMFAFCYLLIICGGAYSKKLEILGKQKEMLKGATL